MYVIIVGAGKLGYQLSELFSLKDNNVALIDINNEALLKASAHLDLLTVNDNGLNLSSLQEINVEKADVLIAVTSSDELNMLIATLAKKLGCKKVISRIRNPEHMDQLEFLKQNLNIDYVSNPEFEVAKEIFKTLFKKEGVNTEDFAKGKVIMSDMKVVDKSALIDQPLKGIDLPHKVLIIGILRSGVMIIPHGNTIVLKEDILYVIGVKDEVHEFIKQNGISVAQKSAKRVMIIGGGKAAFYLAKKLLKTDVSVKIIERDKERCKYLAQELKRVLVIHGDATDINLLIEEGIGDMDAVVTLTGFDEENILLSMVAKKNSVPKVVTKVSKSNYVDIIEQLGTEHVINPILVTASGIMRNIYGGKILSIAMLLGGQAEVVEIIVNEKSLVVNQPLYSVNLPEGIIVGSVVKNGKVYIPNGETVIEPGNRVIVFCLKEETHRLEEFFYGTKRGFINELWHGK
ncbi:Trk system potassium transporter TrkA [Fusibacter tunisiensis]|uniref:Trk system potassium uptake protein TrkA n=1 Tax=Fusibacter tunisiensis TaxID=1008308 RepID=A0ABS2MSA9_9FIRM|nr:Trk system potassium transporter TrkA [Fusibacter tunisiensis]MBM7562290.1 trk system potassium uptake protein TrkA [Fusibacter tunisiensis]